MSKKINIKEALGFMDKNYGDDIVISSCEIVNNDVKVIWNEVDDTDKYFSMIGYSKFGKIIEKIGGEM